MKISDFSISDTLSAHSPPSLDTLRYCAPETLHSARSPTERGDVYACALLFYEMMTCEVPFGDVRTCEELFGKVTSGWKEDSCHLDCDKEYIFIFFYNLFSSSGVRPPVHCPSEPNFELKVAFQDIIFLGWSANPASRPSIATILKEAKAIIDSHTWKM